MILFFLSTLHSSAYERVFPHPPESFFPFDNSKIRRSHIKIYLLSIKKIYLLSSKQVIAIIFHLHNSASISVPLMKLQE